MWFSYSRILHFQSDASYADSALARLVDHGMLSNCLSCHRPIAV